jgi:hypothetical protein
MIACTGASLGVEFRRPKSPARTKASFCRRLLPPPPPPRLRPRGQIFATVVRTVLPLDVEVLDVVVAALRGHPVH